MLNDSLRHVQFDSYDTLQRGLLSGVTLVITIKNSFSSDMKLSIALANRAQNLTFVRPGHLNMLLTSPDSCQLSKLLQS